MVCAHYGSESHRTGETVCAKYCTLCKEPGHGQKRTGCKFRVCNKCGASGHSASECTPCSECGSTTHKSALSVACPEHKCSNCQGTLEPKGHKDLHNRMIALECKGASNAAAHLTKALLASRVLSTSAAIAKARSNQRATTETIALECKLRCAKNVAKPATARTNARFVRAMHVVFEVTNYKRAILS
jgi:hypothetical protein